MSMNGTPLIILGDAWSVEAVKFKFYWGNFWLSTVASKIYTLDYKID